VLPLKDPTSDMAVISRKGSTLVKQVRYRQAHHSHLMPPVSSHHLPESCTCTDLNRSNVCRLPAEAVCRVRNSVRH
jgi:hypothetical protein